MKNFSHVLTTTLTTTYASVTVEKQQENEVALTLSRILYFYQTTQSSDDEADTEVQFHHDALRRYQDLKKSQSHFVY